MVDGHFVEWEFKALYYWEFNFARLPIDYRILVTEDCCTNLNEQDFTGTSFRRDCGKIAEWKLEILPNLY